ncbi:MAG: hypothetical protein DWH79_04035 [Planctomycetota bacterium]|nr:MAG: hypothetical protein DWH79_04035 [Planctomycetota bacterium]
MSTPSRRRAPLTALPEEEAGMMASLLARRAGLGAVVVVLAAVAAGALVWRRVADQVRWGDDALLMPDHIELRGQAPWVRADIRSEALHAASLDKGLPIADPELPTRLARAFDMHPWVRRVVRVDLHHPAAAVVEVQCREPAAMVGVAGGLLAVDAEGVVLPSADFDAESAARYPRLSGIESSPQGSEGANWGDPAVEEGAAVAHCIGPDWRALGLSECRPITPPAGVAVPQGAARQWELVSREGEAIRFGSAPGREARGEPTAAAKIARLRSLVGQPATGEPVDLSLVPPGA